MSLSLALIAPFLLLLDPAAAGERTGAPPTREPAARSGAKKTPEPVRSEWPQGLVSHSFLPEPAWQVRIEQRMTIRIAPRASRIEPNAFDGLPTRAIGPRFEERRIGRCLPVTRIAGVQPNGGSNLILYLRDRRMISASLERACRARDFYSGFYLSSSSDGNLCVDRDALQSRSGASCKLTRIRQLVEVDE